MNKRQKLVQQQFLNNEEAVIKRLKSVYGQSLKDINKSVFELDSSISMLQKALDSIDGDEIGELAAAVLKGKSYYTPEEAQETIKSMLQSKVYQKNYQKALKKQVGGILDKMHDKEFKTVSDYLDKCYEDGFVGTMFDLQGQGIPMCFPLDQEAMVRAVQLDSKISKGLYTRLGEDVALLKKKITAQVSRGISTGMSYQQVAQQLAGYTNIGFNNAVRIARTEGHRVQVQSGMDACYKAKEKGADVVKQWDSTLDDRTRESHAAVDGEIRELDEAFSNGLMFPGDPDGGAAEVINCRCALLQRARWALDEEELETLKKRAEYFGLDKSDTFEEYKKKYLKVADNYEGGGVDLGISTLEELQKYSTELFKKHGVSVDVKDVGKSVDSAKDNIDNLDELLSEYNSTMRAFSIQKGSVSNEGGATTWVNGNSVVRILPSDIRGGVGVIDQLNLGDRKHLGTVTHEFAHTLSNHSEGVDDAFWKEVSTVRTKYRKALKEIEKAELVDHTMDAAQAVAARRSIFISDYSGKDLDEFLAEAFTQAKLGVSPSPYSVDVLKIVDKYFKKPLTNSSGSAIMQMGNVEVRKWYVDKVSKIADSIDKSLTIEERARRAFEARNAIRTEARNLMADQTTRRLLDKEHPNKTFEELVESKMKRKGMTREEAVQDVFETATKTNADINKELGLGGN